jgi:hypothetical protein
VRFEPVGRGYAPRRPSLVGARVGFLDGWGDPTENSIGMYPTMAEIERVLVQSFGIGEVVWQLKPSVSNEVPQDMLEEFANRVDVVVNGQGL